MTTQANSFGPQRMALGGKILGVATAIVVAFAPETFGQNRKSTKGKSSTPSAAASSRAAVKKQPAATPESAGSDEGAKGQSKPSPLKEPKQSAGDSKRPADAGPNATIAPSELKEFSRQPEPVQRLIRTALELTKRDLTYKYGSADPASGGMDCSGTIYFLLREMGLPDVPRDSRGQYLWARKAGGFRAVISKKADSFEFNDLKPGDLLFWSGTYEIDRDPPITHTMIYLGTEKKSGNRVIVGASDGRSYQGVRRWGVSVFDFKMPRTGQGSNPRTDFVGYARIPGLVESNGERTAAGSGESAAPVPTKTGATAKRGRSGH